jgi:hypothetical protein
MLVAQQHQGEANQQQQPQQQQQQQRQFSSLPARCWFEERRE